ncbi:MAG: hypothetical protein XD63_1004 [Thermoanaerobacterales bacterium 50_218]|nr:MAG: hypothetical protein XD63_1004 [Thermoanaerobacterales bacterium 50_218]HAA90076.1 hypothetical protein [Peptococcaceae bacterium]
MHGSIWVYRLYDVAQEIDLSRAGRILAAKKPVVSRLKLSKVHPKALEIKNPPLTVELERCTLRIRNKEFPVFPRGRAYDFGVLSVILRIQLPENLKYGELRKLAVSINESKELENLFTTYRDDLLEALGPALIDAGISGFVEDFTIFFFERWPHEWDPVPLLLGEADKVSKDMRRETLKNQFSYSDDRTIITWDAALVCEPSGSTDVPDLLEFANAQLLELRYYDNVLDRELAAMYDAIAEAGKGGYRRLKKYREIMRQMMELVLDVTEITEKVQNALKVTEDVFYMRVYTAALKIFRVQEWLRSIERKIEVIERNYTMLSDELVTHRFLLLEVAIVILITLEVILWFWAP